MAMEWSPTPWGSGTTTLMIEQAEEELQILEAQHPNRFAYLKLDLKSFIHLLQSHHHLQPSNTTTTNPVLLPASSAATTQGSSTRTRTRTRTRTSKKRKKGTNEARRVAEAEGFDNEPRSQKIQRPDCEESFNMGRDRDGVEVGVQRAQACLRKIQQFKTSF